MRKAVIASGLALTLAGCQFIPGTEANDIDKAKTRIKFVSSMPQTVMFADVKRTGENVCGYVNMKLEGEDEMVGSSPFIAHTEKTDAWMINFGGDTWNCEFDVLFEPCINPTADKAAIRQRCDAELAEQKAEDEASHEKFKADLIDMGIKPTGDLDRDRKLWMDALDYKHNEFMKTFGR